MTTTNLDNLALIDSKANPESGQILKSEMENLRLNLNKLSDEHQDVLLWYYIDGYSYKEIANFLDKSEGAVRVLASRALAELREKMS